MFANRFTVVIDACSLVSALGRNTVLSLAEAELFRVRWSEEILAETEVALAKVLASHGRADYGALAHKHVAAIQAAFPEAVVENYQQLMGSIGELPDSDDEHVLCAAIQCRASVVVTENTRHFPRSVLDPVGIEAKTSDDFIADAIDLDPLVAISALAKMRSRFWNPQLSASDLLLRYESNGLIQTADLLRPYESQL